MYGRWRRRRERERSHIQHTSLSLSTASLSQHGRRGRLPFSSLLPHKCITLFFSSAKYHRLWLLPGREWIEAPVTEITTFYALPLSAREALFERERRVQ